MFLSNYKEFLNKFLQKINDLGIDVSKYDLDHLGYQASSNEEYDQIKPEVIEIADLMSENIVGGRRVGVFKLHEPLRYKHYVIEAFELIAPKAGQICPSGLDHAEFVIDQKFNEFMARYPEINWDISAVNQPVFPMVKLNFGDNMTAKFHYEPVLKIISKEQNFNK